MVWPPGTNPPCTEKTIEKDHTAYPRGFKTLMGVVREKFYSALASSQPEEVASGIMPG